MESSINLKKLGYVERLLHKTNDSLAKTIFVIRMYDYMFTSTSHIYSMKGFVPDICSLVIRLGLGQHLESYALLGTFPNKLQWRGIRIHAIKSQEINRWHYNFNLKQDCPLATLCIRGIRPHILYKIVKEKPSERSHILTCMKLFTVQYNSDAVPCKLCGKCIHYLPLHIVMECSALCKERCELFDNIVNDLEVNQSVNLFEKVDLTILSIIMGGQWDIFRAVKRENYVSFIVNALKMVKTMMITHGGIY